MSNKLYFWGLFVVSVVLFFAPITRVEGVGLGLDKLAHVILFAGLLFFGQKAFSSGIASVRSRSALAMTILLVLYAVAVEVVQGEFLPYRSFDFWDMVAGWAGLALVLTFTSLRGALLRSNPSEIAARPLDARNDEDKI